MIEEGDLVSHYDRECYNMGIVTSVLEFEDDYEHGCYLGYCQVHWCAGDKVLETVDLNGDWYAFDEIRILSRRINWPTLDFLS